MLEPENENVQPANNLPPQLLPFVDALAELLVCAYLQDTVVRVTGDLPETPKKQNARISKPLIGFPQENTGTDTGEDAGEDTEGNTGLNPRG